MIKANQTIVKVIVLLLFITSETNLFSQKAAFSIYNLIPEYVDSKPVKDTLAQKADVYSNFTIYSDLNKSDNDKAIQEHNFTHWYYYDFLYGSIISLKNSITSFFFTVFEQ
jgi:hypothetical protein